jgi:oligopeptide/dipeptide ABC transporter ATP-binding protein
MIEASACLVELDHITVRFGRLCAVDNVSLTIGPAEVLGLVGESGSGKSTIGNVIAGLQGLSAGRWRFHGEQPRRNIQMVFQDPYGALDPRMPLAALIGEPLRIHRIGNAAQRRARVDDLLHQVGLPTEAMHRYPHEFSGGQRQRIAIARALAPEPALIIADEPLSALDVSIQSQILNLFSDIRAARPIAMLFISHDLAVVHHLADRVAVLYLGRLMELAPRDELFRAPAHPYTWALLAAVPRIGRRRVRNAAIAGEMPSPLAPPPGCVFHPRCPRQQAICRAEAPMLLPVAARTQHVAACHFPA